MEKYTNEKSLMVVQDSFLKKIKNFFVRFFWSKNNDDEQYDQVDVKGIQRDVETIEKNDIIKEDISVTKTRKLYNFDAEDNGEWPENNNDSNETEEQKNEEEEQDSDIDYEREPISEVCREKEELEQKLRNYYASITKMHN